MIVVRLQISFRKTNQSGYEPLNLENGSSVNSDNFDTTDLRSYSVEFKLTPIGIVKKGCETKRLENT